VLSFGGIYGSTKECIQVKGLYAVGGKIYYGWEKLFYSRLSLIVAGFQPIVMGRAKIMPGVECRIKLYVNTSLYDCWFSLAVRLLGADKISCMVEQTMIIGGDLLGYGRKIIAG